MLDYGSKTFKAGFAYNFPSEEEPRVVTPTAVEISSTKATNAEAAAEHHDVHFPVCRGKVQSLEELEELTHYALYELLGWEMGEEGSVIVSEPVLTSKSDREQMAQLFFEVFNVDGLYTQDQATLSLYAVGRLSGCVVDVGHGKVSSQQGQRV